MPSPFSPVHWTAPHQSSGCHTHCTPSPLTLECPQTKFLNCLIVFNNFLNNVGYLVDVNFTEHD